jgi:hypothetical protein
LLPLSLLPLKLNQLPLNLLQLAHLSGKGMAALTALLSLAGHCSEALGAHFHRWRLLNLPLSLAIKAPFVADKWVVKPSAVIHMVKDQ